MRTVRLTIPELSELLMVPVVRLALAPIEEEPGIDVVVKAGSAPRPGGLILRTSIGEAWKDRQVQILPNIGAGI